MGDDGKLQKMEVDYSSTVDEKIPECEKMAKVSAKISWQTQVPHNSLKRQ